MASAELSPIIKITLQLMRPDTGNDCVFCRPIGRVSDIRCVHVKATKCIYQFLSVATDCQICCRLQYCKNNAAKMKYLDGDISNVLPDGRFVISHSC